jgi:putative NIF3 family GTP cyclohydrolase 1 type 2
MGATLRGESMRNVWFACVVLMIALAGVASGQEARVTAREVVAQIQKQVGIAWMTETVDTFKAGNPDTPVTGIAVTMMATMDVLERAADKHLNFIITHEPTFFSHEDVPEEMPENDPVWAEKRAFIERHGLVMWRFHDHWHRMKPDGIELGTMRALGWEKYQNPENQFLFVLPQTTLRDLARDVAQKLGAATMRVVGDPEMKVTQVALSPGYEGFVKETHALERDDVQVLLAGETREWETVEYVADAVAQGRKKALIVIGHVPSEQAGMEECARWMGTFVKGTRIEFVPTKEAFWGVKQSLNTKGTK